MKARSFFLMAAAALILAGCGGSGALRPAAKAGWVSREDVGEAIALLNRGEPEHARRVLARVLQQQPGDPIAAKLMRQIDTPPEKLLGQRNFAYVTRADDTMSTLSQRFLRDPMMFYALARYNGIAAPGNLEAGRTLRIPGRLRQESTRKAATQPSVPTPAPAVEPVAPAKEARPAPPPSDPRRAAQLRAQGLEQLNRGAVDRAVALLQQASRLDPGSSLIRRDLGRAMRIQRTVRGHGA